jgi:hypothetical protein
MTNVLSGNTKRTEPMPVSVPQLMIGLLLSANTLGKKINASTQIANAAHAYLVKFIAHHP